MRRLLPLAMLFACAGGAEAPEPSRPLPAGQVPIGVALGPDGMTVRTDKGTIEWEGEGAPARIVAPKDPGTPPAPVVLAFPVDFPVPQYPGSVVVLSATESDPAGRAVFLTTPDAAAAVLAFYQGAYPEAVSTRVEAPTGPATTVKVTAADGRRAVTVGPHASGTSIALYFEPAAP